MELYDWIIIFAGANAFLLAYIVILYLELRKEKAEYEKLAKIHARLQERYYARKLNSGSR